MSKYKKKRESAKLDLTPLIDVVFLLLIFFMLATSFDERSAFKIDLPKSTAAKTKSTLKEVQVLVDKEKNIYLRYTDNSGKSQSEKLDLSSFVSVVSEKLNTSESKDVMISADKAIDYGFIVEIMSLLKESGASAINIDTAIKSR